MKKWSVMMEKSKVFITLMICAVLGVMLGENAQCKYSLATIHVTHERRGESEGVEKHENNKNAMRRRRRQDR
jgi:hypothetical protein